MFEVLEKSLNAYLDEITECLDFIAASSKLRPWLADYIDWKKAAGASTQLITRFLDRKHVNEQVLYRALYVTGHSAFEQFSRDMIAAAVDFISTKVTSYDDLWDEIKTEHIRRTGQAMETIRQPLEHYPFDYQKLCKNIGGCTPGRAAFTLNSDALALIRGNLTCENLDKVIKRLTITVNWDALATHPKMKNCCQATGTRERGKELQAFLDSMVKTRNRIAHTTNAAPEIGEPQVREQVRFIGSFCIALGAQVKTEIIKKVAACTKARSAASSS